MEICCPSSEELSIIVNNVECKKCGLKFRNMPRFRMHDLKVHQHRNLNKIVKENIKYHCPVQSCIYAPTSERHFSTMKYLKQHYLKVHAEKTFSCTKCSKSFSTEAAKDAHIRICGTKFICLCSKTFMSYEALLTHAKRSSHTIDGKYKNLLRRSNTKQPKPITSNLKFSKIDKPITILPICNVSTNIKTNSSHKVMVDIGVQTEDLKRIKRLCSPHKFRSVDNSCNFKRKESKHTQTNSIQKYKCNNRSKETQTLGMISNLKGKCKIHKGQQNNEIIKASEHLLIKDCALSENFTPSNLFPGSPLPLRHDVGLQDFWEKCTSGTQTLPAKDMFEVLNDNVTQTEFSLPFNEDVSTGVEGYSFTTTSNLTQSDPMLTEETFDDKFSSIETQTEQAYSQSFFDSDPLSRTFALSSNIETQTTDNLNNMEQLLYNNTYTQTCNEILSPDLNLTNIQTQTSWTQLNDTTVSTETQTKTFYQTGCNDSMGICRSWLNTQISHTETQTDLLSIFEDFR